MGAGIPGIGKLLGSIGGVAGQFNQHQLTQQDLSIILKQTYLQQKHGMIEALTGKTKIIAKDINRDAYIVEQEASGWLHSRIERVRLLGREWLEGKRLKVRTTVDAIKIAAGTFKGQEEQWEGSGIPVKKLRNGDFVWTGEPPTEYKAKWGLSGGGIQS